MFSPVFLLREYMIHVKMRSMKNMLNSLPSDVNELKKLVTLFQEENTRLLNTLKQKDETLEKKKIILEEKNQTLLSKDKEISYLYTQWKLALQRHYGRRSEKLCEEAQKQMHLFDEMGDLTVEEAKAVDAVEAQIQITAHTRKKTRKSRKLSEAFPREEKHYDLPASEKRCHCGAALKPIGEAISEQVDIIPAQIKVIKHIQHKYACSQYEEHGVVVAKKPRQAVGKTLAAPGMLAHVMVAKYADHLPLYRQEQMFQRMGIPIIRKTLCQWMMKSADALACVYDKMKEEIAASCYVQADETPVKMLKGKGQQGTVNGYLWAYRIRTKAQRFLVLFDYQQSRHGQWASTFLEGFQGALQSDGYSGYHQLLAEKSLVGYGCWDHGRRKFKEVTTLSKKKTGKAYEALSFITKLYHIENQIRHDPPEKREAYRKQYAPEVLEKFRRWLEKSALQVSPQNPLGKAIQYTLNQWPRLTRYVNNGVVEMSNILIENQIRPFAVGRRNWLFLGSERGGKAAATIYSLIQSAKMNDLEPYAYLKHVLTQLPEAKANGTLDALLPFNLNQTQLMDQYR